MKEVLYLSGAISPTKENPDINKNVQRFVDKGIELSKEYAVFLPGENNYKMGVQDNWNWKDFMRADIPFVLKADVIYMLSNWETSRGARIEHWLAKRHNKRIIYE